jgi:hypothetical protein
MTDPLTIKGRSCGSGRGRKSHDSDGGEGVTVHVRTFDASFNVAVISLEGDQDGMESMAGNS